MNTNNQKKNKSKIISVLETVDIETGVREVLHEFDYRIEAPNWRKNGRELVYNSEGRIYSYDIVTGVSKEIESGICINCNNDHVLSYDDHQIAVSHHSMEDGKSRIYILPIEGGEPVLVTQNGPSYLHGWSPDGSMLAFCGEREGEYDVYTIPAAGGEEIRLTDAVGLDDGPEYSPCGSYIWFNSVRSGLMQIWRMKTDGSEQTQMTFDESNNWFAHPSPDGKLIAYLSYQKGDVAPGDHPANKNVEIRLMPAGGGEYKTLVRLFGGQGTINVNSWSPCGKKLAFVSYRLEP